MNTILLNRLSTIASNIDMLAQSEICSDIQNLEEAKIHAAKLKSMLTRFETELLQYFNLCNEPDADEISNLTTIQLKGEEVLAGLTANINIKSDPSAPRTVTSDKRLSKLPELSIPTFSGDLLEWHQFWDQFQSCIDQRNLPDVDKLMYLKASLRGEAKKTIEGLDTTNKNYGIAISTLKERYGKEDLIIDAHYSTLYKIKRAEKIEDCRKTLNEIERHIRVLHSLGEDISHNHLRFMIMEKFPEDIIYEIKMKVKAESIEDLRKQLAIIITAREDASRIFSEKSRKEGTQYTAETLHVKNESNNGNRHFTKARPQLNNQRFNKGKQTFQGRGSMNFNFNKNSRPNKRRHETENDRRHFDNKRFKYSCFFCQGQHYNDECKQFKTLEERKRKLINRCYKCFRLNHPAKQCRERKLTCPHCGQFDLHNRALCPKLFKREDTSKGTTVMHASNNVTRVTFLQTAVTMVGGDNKSMKCRILLDSGSQRSYITQQVFEELGLKIEEENQLTVFTFGAKEPRRIESPLVKLTVELVQPKDLQIVYANVVPSISQGIEHPGYLLDSCNLKGQLNLADDGSLMDRVDMLIGNDYYYSLMSTGKVQVTENLFLVESKLGWILSGTTKVRPADELTVNTYFQSSFETRIAEPDLPLDNGNLNLLWDLESIGITDSPKANRDEEAINNFNETTVFKDDRYYVSWPWNEYPPNLESNFGLAFGRLIGLLKRLDLSTLDTYDKLIKDQQDKGIIEIVPEKDLNISSHPVHYLPHHGVCQPGKSLRIVYDASACTKGNKSLNQFLYCGPMMLEDLTGLLIKFRCHLIGITADVEKAFLQIGLNDKDRDVTRFVWLKDITKAATDDNLLHFRFTRVPFGIISSPFLLNATIKHHLSLSEKGNIRDLTDDIYVDNLVTGTSTPQEALKLYEDSKNTFNQISMNLRQWSSNSKEMMENVQDACPDKTVKLLGLDWNLNDDTLQLRTKRVDNANTKRGVLKTVASIYDPCGFSVPVMLPAKLFLQDLWKLKIKWDKPLPKELVDKWKEIQEDIYRTQEISLSRCFITSMKQRNCQIHCFTDASKKAYAAVVYIVSGDSISFAIGKSRLVPIKDQADLKIPRLELLGVLIGSRLIQYLLRFIKINVTGQFLWTDSQIVIDWYKSHKLLTPFVSRRIEEIKNNRNLTVRYVPSDLNPADVATRPNGSKEDQARWLAGPSFLLQKPSDWPANTVRILDTSLVAAEGPADVDHSVTTSSEIDMNQLNVSAPLDTGLEIVEDTSNTKGFDTGLDNENHNTTNIQNSTLEEIKVLQSEHFTKEVKGIETNLSRNLRLFKDDQGLLRCKGRMRNTNWSFDKKYPVLLPRSCQFTEKIIKEIHEKNYHVGANHTLSLIREVYWIPQGKSQVQKVIRKCQRCVKHGGGPYRLPPTPALPPERVNFSMPFTFTGVDYLGPLTVKTENGTSKRWICLFTCLAVRAIHLEVVQDLTAEEGLLALRRLIATRGIPALITSDNASYFKLLAEILSKSYCVDNKIQWRFIPELAPWYGGYYERLVAMVKHCMKRSLQKHLLRDSQLSTVVKEIEAVLNTRPLTCVDSEIEHILKPADFLNLGRCITMETSQEHALVQGTTTKKDLVTAWRRARILVEEFKEMFCNRYLASLRERYNNSHKDPRVTSRDNPKEGQVVQIKGDKNREGWKVGKIISLSKGSDGLCRVAQVRVGDKVFTRSVGHLYPLEIDDTDQQHNVLQDTETSNGIEAQDEVNGESISIPAAVINDRIEVNEFRSQLTPTEPTRVETIPNMDMDVTDRNLDMTEDMEMSYDYALSNYPDMSDGEQSSEVEQDNKRRAAVRALEKIREWTRDLMTTV